ncbi:hypothetical protein CBM2609_A170100 [Cupriavidus taiwanensis]|nr:hypothetical protein CBM2604_A140100 [Cupriavidus taiwanensis]SOZ25837.1 hypothetical protein CBM2609_A170100 [Cupriavidus taiwanensis]SOZ45045.1 hypothetical protein CBM2610_A160098 [Cupriavidus taiwanensis]
MHRNHRDYYFTVTWLAQIVCAPYDTKPILSVPIPACGKTPNKAAKRPISNKHPSLHVV